MFASVAIDQAFGLGEGIRSLRLYRSEFKGAEVRGAAGKAVIDAGDHDAPVYGRAR